MRNLLHSVEDLELVLVTTKCHTITRGAIEVSHVALIPKTGRDLLPALVELGIDLSRTTKD